MQRALMSFPLGGTWLHRWDRADIFRANDLVLLAYSALQDPLLSLELGFSFVVGLRQEMLAKYFLQLLIEFFTTEPIHCRCVVEEAEYVLYSDRVDKFITAAREERASRWYNPDTLTFKKISDRFYYYIDGPAYIWEFPTQCSILVKCCALAKATKMINVARIDGAGLSCVSTDIRQGILDAVGKCYQSCRASKASVPPRVVEILHQCTGVEDLKFPQKASLFSSAIGLISSLYKESQPQQLSFLEKLSDVSQDSIRAGMKKGHLSTAQATQITSHLSLLFQLCHDRIGPCTLWFPPCLIGALVRLACGLCARVLSWMLKVGHEDGSEGSSTSFSEADLDFYVPNSKRLGFTWEELRILDAIFIILHHSIITEKSDPFPWLKENTLGVIVACQFVERFRSFIESSDSVDGSLYSEMLHNCFASFDVIRKNLLDSFAWPCESYSLIKAGGALDVKIEGSKIANYEAVLRAFSFNAE